MSEHFEPAAGCRCGSCLELRGCVEQAEVWQARATQAEARVAELEAAVAEAMEHIARLEIRDASLALSRTYPHSPRKDPDARHA